MKTPFRLGLAACMAGIVTLGTATAFACKDGKGHGARFERADKNGDGFLTQAEVGERRWERIKVADSNNDGKVSKDEMSQAKKDGKLKRRGHRKAAKS
jgi:Ca2+-binding EF-hand superfamily protein